MTSPTEHVQVNSKQKEPNKEISQKITSNVQVKPKQENPKQVKLSIQPISMKKPERKKQGFHGINATHINGILIEPIHASYNRNIYFTVKTTCRSYVGRLFLQMLTWFQVVDKNKVRHC